MFDWLPISDRKTLPKPRVIISDVNYCGGAFCPRTECRHVWKVGDVEFDSSESDVILLSSRRGEPTAIVIAHEHRHLQQHYLLSLPKFPLYDQGLNFDFSSWATWEEEINRYYRLQSWEMDALLYSKRIVGDCEHYATVFGAAGSKSLKTT